jgi:LL-diaminopimelate aminotransferase
MQPNANLKKFSTYAFAEVEKARDEAQNRGFRIIDFGVGDPTEPLFEGAMIGLQRGARKHSRSGYPSHIGMRGFRQAASEWLGRRFGVRVNPETQVTSTAGSKEAVFHFPFAFINPGDCVLMPSIGYPPYKAGTVFAGGTPVYYKLQESNNFLPNLDEIESILEVNRSIKIIWINYPHNPTTVIADGRFFENLIELSQSYNVIIASDEAYTEIYAEEKPHSILEFTDDWSRLIVFQSLSKRSNATGLRVGFAVGGEEVIGHYRNLRTQIDSGVANSIQEAAICALRDEEHVGRMRELYNRKRSIMTAALGDIGLLYWSEATLYVWARTPESSLEFSNSLLRLDKDKKIGINTTPGSMLALNNEEDADRYVRFALVPTLEDTELAADLLRKYL